MGSRRLELGNPAATAQQVLSDGVREVEGEPPAWYGHSEWRDNDVRGGLTVRLLGAWGWGGCWRAVCGWPGACRCALLQWDGFMMSVMSWQPLLGARGGACAGHCLAFAEMLAAATYGSAHEQRARSSSTLHPPTSCRPLDHRFVQDLGSHRALFIGREGQRDEQRDWRHNEEAQVGWGGSEPNSLPSLRRINAEWPATAPSLLVQHATAASSSALLCVHLAAAVTAAWKHVCCCGPAAAGGAAHQH